MKITKCQKYNKVFMKNILSWELHEILFKYLIERLHNPLNWKLRRIDNIIMTINDHDNKKQWKYYIA